MHPIVNATAPQSRETKAITLANIPAFPAVVLRVLDIVSQEEPDFPLLVREIASDATLSAQVLRLANSARFGFAAQIGTVQHAVLALGSSEVQSLVMSVAIANYSRASLKTEAMQRCWRHTVASAVLSREVARTAGMPHEQAYSLGLLHDIGRLGLLVAWPDDYNRLLNEADHDNLSLLDLEKRLFTMDHCEVGRRLVEQWKLPPDFCLVAGHHHDPLGYAEELDQLSVANFGCRMADSLEFWVAKPLHETPFEAIRAELPGVVRHRFPSDPAALKNLVEQSFAGGGVIPDQSPSEYIQIPRVQPGSSADTPSDTPGKEHTAENRDAAPKIEVRPIAWDLAIVLASVLAFAGVMIALLIWQS